MISTDTLFTIAGEKVESLLMTDEALLFSSKSAADPEAFRAAWDKKLSLANKITVRYDAIKSIRKEQNSDTVILSYKTAASLPAELKFAFGGGHEAFFDALEREHYFVREEGQATPLKAARGAGFGFLVAGAVTYFLVQRATALANGTAVASHRAKGRLMDLLLGALGPTGTLLVGGAIAAYLLYRAVTRYRNPPLQIVLQPRIA